MDYENNLQKLKQSSFTRRAKPLMANKGWEYSKNNLASLTYWNDSDMDKLDRLDINYKYGVKINPNKYQPLFDKTNIPTNQHRNITYKRKYPKIRVFSLTNGKETT